MIERKIVGEKFKSFEIAEFIKKDLGDVPIKEINVVKTSVGERITIFTSTPGLVIGREGSNIKRLTNVVKERFNLENPVIKIGEVKNPYLSAAIVAKIIANDLARFGSQKFKLSGFKAITAIMESGAMGVEIRITGKLPSARSKSWRFNKGYIKKTGYVSDFVIDKAEEKVTLKTGVVGIKVQIMLPDTPLPDKIVYVSMEKPQKSPEELNEEISEVKEEKIVTSPEDAVAMEGEE